MSSDDEVLASTYIDAVFACVVRRLKSFHRAGRYMQISRRDNLYRIRSSLGALAAHADDGAEVYARATPRRAEITEKYYVVQELSKNRSTDWGDELTGRIEIEVPYDGYRCFPRSACDDVAKRVTGGAEDGGRTAVIGHLLLNDYEKTDLRGGLHLHDRNGAVPMEVPVPDGDDLDELTADTQTCVIKHDFQPQAVEIFPGQLSIDIYDPDSLELPTVSLLDLQETSLTAPEVRALIDDVIRQIKRQVNFRNELCCASACRSPCRSRRNRPHPSPGSSEYPSAGPRSRRCRRSA